MSVLRSSEKISNLSDKNVSQVASFEFLGIYTKKQFKIKWVASVFHLFICFSKKKLHCCYFSPICSVP